MPKVPRIPVTSSNVAAVGYDAADWALVVEFRSGGIYRYPGIGADIFWAMLKGSVGGYFARHLKAAPFEKLSAWPDAAERAWPVMWTETDLPRTLASGPDVRWADLFALVVLPKLAQALFPPAQTSAVELLDAAPVPLPGAFNAELAERHDPRDVALAPLSDGGFRRVP